MVPVIVEVEMTFTMAMGLPKRKWPRAALSHTRGPSARMD